MRTVRRSGRLVGGVCPLEGCVPGVYTTHPPRTEFLTFTCENIIFPQLLLRTVITKPKQGYIQ